ncbi:protein SPMIP2 [Cavia porcellus]|uniref:protein SPMIP2 n=1 Tax=Cavia porcellus TaxID=10141 RepID=UPI002FE41726
MASLSYQEPLSATVGKRMVVTGPDYKRDHLPKVQPDTSYIGEKWPELEKTGDLQYLWRPASDRSAPAKYKHEYVGEVGWGIPEYNFINRSRLASGFHIKYGEFSLDAIDKCSHRYQNPWQPNPSVLDQQDRYSRAFLAWHMGDYEDTHQRNSKRATLVKQSKSSPGKSHPPRLPMLPTKQGKRRFQPLSPQNPACF